MKIEETKKVSVEVEKLKNIKCDICNKTLLKKGEESVLGGALVGYKFKMTDDGGTFEERETSEFCNKCYSEIVAYLRTEKKAKIPSFYFSTDDSEEYNDERQESKAN